MVGLPTMLLATMLTPVKTLKCNEGFNLEIGGIRNYNWTIQQCEEGDVCVIEEFRYDSGNPEYSGQYITIHIHIYALVTL